MRDTPELRALKRAIKLAGGQSALGRAIGKQQSVVRDWLVRRKRAPAEACGPIETATGVTRAELRPDIYA